MGLFHRRSGGDHHDEAAHRQPFSWKLPRQASSLAPEDVYTNADLDPTTDPAQRTWGYGTWVSPARALWRVKRVQTRRGTRGVVRKSSGR